MATIRVDTKAFKQDGDLLNIAVQDNDQDDPKFKAFEMTVLRGMTIEEMGQIALDQPVVQIPDSVFNGTFDITFHVETDSQTGASRRVLDSITRIV